jgi:hypothetical protein
MSFVTSVLGATRLFELGLCLRLDDQLSHQRPLSRGSSRSKTSDLAPGQRLSSPVSA